MKFLFKDIYTDLTDQFEIRSKWEKKKNQIRFICAFLIAFFLFIACELSTINFSLSQEILNKIISNSDLLKNLIQSNILHKFFIREITNGNIIVFKLSPIKMLFFTTILFFSYMFLACNDPFSNSELLRNLLFDKNKVKIPFLFRLLYKDLRFYAENLPSNLLLEFCDNCPSYLYCKSRLTSTDPRRTYMWNKIFPRLSPSVINKLLLLTNRCRCIFLLKISLLIVIILLVPLYISMRLISYYYFDLPFYRNDEFLIYSAIILLFFLLLHLLNNASCENRRGVWGHFKEYVQNNLFNFKEVKELFRKENCYCEDDLEIKKKIDSYSYDFQVILTTFYFLEELRKQKLLTSLSPKVKKYDFDFALKKIMTAMVALFEEVFGKAYDFRVTLFLYDANDNFLRPKIRIPFKNDDSIILCEPFTLNDNLLAVKAFNEEKICCASNNEIIFTNEQQRNFLKTIIAFPIIIDMGIFEKIKTKQKIDDRRLGVLCVDSSNSEICMKITTEIFNFISQPFVNRLCMEILYSRSKKYE